MSSGYITWQHPWPPTQNTQTHTSTYTQPGWQKHSIYPNPVHCTSFFFLRLYGLRVGNVSFDLTCDKTFPFKKLITFITSTRRLYQPREALCHWSRYASWGLQSMSVLSALTSVALFFWLANCPADCQTLWWQIRTDKKRNYSICCSYRMWPRLVLVIEQ